MLTGSNLQAYVNISGVGTRGVNQDGTLTTGSGYQFGSPADALAALQTAVANETGVVTMIRVVPTPA